MAALSHESQDGLGYRNKQQSPDPVRMIFLSFPEGLPAHHGISIYKIDWMSTNNLWKQKTTTTTNFIRKSQPLKVTISQSIPTFVILKILKYLEREETGSPQARILVQYQNLILLIFYLFLVETVGLGMTTVCQIEKK